jgi:hypothetical protein
VWQGKNTLTNALLQAARLALSTKTGKPEDNKRIKYKFRNNITEIHIKSLKHELLLVLVALQQERFNYAGVQKL